MTYFFFPSPRKYSTVSVNPRLCTLSQRWKYSATSVKYPIALLADVSDSLTSEPTATRFKLIENSCSTLRRCPLRIRGSLCRRYLRMPWDMPGRRGRTGMRKRYQDLPLRMRTSESRLRQRSRTPRTPRHLLRRLWRKVSRCCPQ